MLRTTAVQLPPLGRYGKYYVYFLSFPDDPELYGKRAGKVFYVGKGTGNRVDQHERETQALLRSGRYMLMKHKHKTILEIWDTGGNVVQTILGRTDSELDAFTVESYHISQIGLHKLTNATYGHKPKTARSPRRS